MNTSVSDDNPDPRLAAWRRLADGDAIALCEDAAVVIAAGVTPAGIARLRRKHPGMPTVEALELADARRRGGAKFEGSERLLLDRQGVEQASGSVVARWKAVRFGSEAVLDLCCGIGGDSMALAARGPCVAVDHDPIRAFMTEHNAGVATRVEAIEETTLDARLVHLDPSRRDESTGRRHWGLEDLIPSLEVIRSIVSQVDGAAVKLGPGLPRPFPVLHERQSISFVTESERLVQAVVWTGSLAREGTVEAVDLPSGATLEGDPESMLTGGTESLFEARDRSECELAMVTFHPAVERGELGPAAWRTEFGSVPLEEPAAGLGLGITEAAAIEPLIAKRGSRWCRPTRILRVVAPRIEAVGEAIEDIVAEWNGSRPERIVVKTRGGAVDADDWTRRLGRLDARASPAGDAGPAIEVHGLRIARRTIACIGMPMG